MAGNGGDLAAADAAKGAAAASAEAGQQSRPPSQGTQSERTAATVPAVEGHVADGALPKLKEQVAVGGGDPQDGPLAEGSQGGSSSGEGDEAGAGAAPGGAVGQTGVREGGRKLTFEDLSSHFALGLREAAANLGVCPTTLKRTCRKMGIRRWPRRHLQKLTRALGSIRRQPGTPIAAEATSGST